jgi:uncharacterized membrane protein
VYRGAPLTGFGLSLAWALLVGLAILAGRFFPVTEAPSVLAGPPFGLMAVGLALLAIYALAWRAKPESEVAVPVRRGAPRGKARG